MRNPEKNIEKNTAGITCWSSYQTARGGIWIEDGWDGLIEAAQHPEPRSGGKQNHPVYAFASFSEGHRRECNLLHCYGMVMDYDSGVEKGNPSLTCEDLLSCWSGWEFLAHTTWSHSSTAARWRVVFPFSRPVDREEFRRITNWAVTYANANGAAGLDADLSWTNPSQCALAPAEAGDYQWFHNSSSNRVTPDELPLVENGSGWGNTRSEARERRFSSGPFSLRQVLAPVATASRGHRTRVLFRAAAQLGREVQQGRADLATVTQQLVDASQKSGLLKDEGEKEILRTIENGLQRGQADSAAHPGRPNVIVRKGEIHKQIEEAELALLQSDVELFEWEGELVQLLACPQSESHEVRIRPVSPDTMSALLTRVSNWGAWSVNARGEESFRSLDPPTRMVRGLLAQGHWKLPSLRGVAFTPILLRNGTIARYPGFDTESGWLLRFPREEYLNWPAPTKQNAMESLQTIREILVNFPFASEVDETVALASILSPFARQAICGSIPLFLFDSHTPGSGKSLLADVVATLATGRRAPRTTQASDEEMRKRITSLLLSGEDFVLLDNITNDLGGYALDAALTSAIWSDRKLGTNEQVKIPMRLLFLATGNNVQIRGDLTRRTLRCRLDPKEEYPEERSNFRHPQLLKWLMEHRETFVVAALTILHSYNRSEEKVSLKPMGSFESWSTWIREPLVWLGMDDPLRSQDGLRVDSDSKRAVYRTLLSSWYGLFGDEPILVSRLLHQIQPRIGGSENDEIRTHKERLREALESLAAGEVRAQVIAQRILVPLRGRIISGHQLERVTRGREGIRWRCVRQGQ